MVKCTIKRDFFGLLRYRHGCVRRLIFIETDIYSYILLLPAYPWWLPGSNQSYRQFYREMHDVITALYLDVYSASYCFRLVCRNCGDNSRNCDAIPPSHWVTVWRSWVKQMCVIYYLIIVCVRAPPGVMAVRFWQQEVGDSGWTDVQWTGVCLHRIACSSRDRSTSPMQAMCVVMALSLRALPFIIMRLLFCISLQENQLKCVKPHFVWFTYLGDLGLLLAVEKGEKC